MPLSEHEQRLLEQMERALYAEDPKLASALRGADPSTHAKRRLVIASVGFVVGIALLMTGVVASIIPLSVAGFVAMVAAAFFAVTSWRALPGSSDTPAPPTGRTPRSTRSRRSSGGLMSKFEERWNRRREDNGR